MNTLHRVRVAVAISLLLTSVPGRADFSFSSSRSQPSVFLNQALQQRAQFIRKVLPPFPKALSKVRHWIAAVRPERELVLADGVGIQAQAIQSLGGSAHTRPSRAHMLLDSLGEIEEEIPLELGWDAQCVRTVLPDQWPDLDRQDLDSLSNKAKTLLFLPELTHSFLANETNDYRAAVIRLYAAALVRQTPPHQRTVLFEEFRRYGYGTWASDLEHLASLRPEHVASAVSQLVYPHKNILNRLLLSNRIERFLADHDTLVDRARAFRIATEQLDASPNETLELCLDLLNKTPFTELLYGKIPAMSLPKALVNAWGPDQIQKLQDAFWTLRHIQGSAFTLVAMPNGDWILYDAYAAPNYLRKWTAKNEVTFLETQEGIEHLFRKYRDRLFIPDSHWPSNGLRQTLATSLLTREPDRGLALWDSVDHFYRAVRGSAGLAHRYVNLLPPAVEENVIATMDRPEILPKVVEAELENHSLFNRPIFQFTVIDDSSDENLKRDRQSLGDLHNRFGVNFKILTRFDRAADQAFIGYKLAERYRRLLRYGLLSPRIRAVLKQHGILANGQIDAERLAQYVSDTVFRHISGVRNYTFLYMRGKRFMHFDDDAPPETYLIPQRELNALRAKRLESRSRVWAAFRAEVAGVLNTPIESDSGLYLRLSQPHSKEQAAQLAELENRYFGFDHKNPAIGLVPQAAGQIFKTDERRDELTQTTRMRLESLMDLKTMSVVLADFVYWDERIEKDAGLFEVLPVDTVGAARHLGAPRYASNLPWYGNDLRGTMGVPLKLPFLQRFVDRKNTYIAYGFVGDQDTSALTQFLRYVLNFRKQAHHLQHANQTSLIAEFVRGFSGLTNVIFNRAAIDFSDRYMIAPTIGRELRWEEPPYYYWVKALLEWECMSYATVAGGQQRSITERLYRISFQDVTEVIGGVARAFYENAANGYRRWYWLKMIYGFGARMRSLGNAYARASSHVSLSQNQINQALEQRHLRARLMSRLAFSIAQEENPALKRQMEVVFFQYAFDFGFYHANNVQREDTLDVRYGKEGAEGYFYEVRNDGTTLFWRRTQPTQTDGKIRWVANDEEESGDVQSLERHPFVLDQALPVGVSVIVPAFRTEDESDYLKNVAQRIQDQMESDGNMLIIWPDILEIADDLESPQTQDIASLRRQLENEDPNVRLQTISRLADITHPDAQAALRSVVDGKQPENIRLLARAALARYQTISQLAETNVQALLQAHNVQMDHWTNHSDQSAQAILQFPESLDADARKAVLLKLSLLLRDIDCSFGFSAQPLQDVLTTSGPVHIQFFKREYRPQGTSLDEVVDQMADDQRSIIGADRDKKDLTTFFRIWEEGEHGAIHTLAIYKDGRQQTFFGAIPSSVMNDPELSHLVIQNTGRASRPNRAGAGSKRIGDDQRSFLWPEIVPEDATQLRVHWVDSHGKPFSIMGNPAPYLPPTRPGKTETDAPVQIVVSRSDQHVRQKNAGDSENLDSLIELYVDLNRNRDSNKTAYRVGINGWYGHDGDNAPKAAASQSQLHFQGMNRRFPIENKPFNMLAENEGVQLSVLADTENEGSMIAIAARLDRWQDLRSVRDRIIGQIRSQGYAFNVTVVPDAREGYLRVLIAVRPESMPQETDFNNEWGILELGDMVIVDDSERFYTLTPSQLTELAGNAPTTAWLNHQKSMGALQIADDLPTRVKRARSFVTLDPAQLDELLRQALAAEWFNDLGARPESHTLKVPA